MLSAKQIDLLIQATTKEELDQEVYPNFANIKIVSDNISKIIALALLNEEISTLGESFSDFDIQVVTKDMGTNGTIERNGMTFTIGVPKGERGDKGDTPVLSVDAEGNLIVSYEDGTNEQEIGVY